jgi:hypothetical protein
MRHGDLRRRAGRDLLLSQHEEAGAFPSPPTAVTWQLRDGPLRYAQSPAPCAVAASSSRRHEGSERPSCSVVGCYFSIGVFLLPFDPHPPKGLCENHGSRGPILPPCGQCGLLQKGAGRILRQGRKRSQGLTLRMSSGQRSNWCSLAQTRTPLLRWLLTDPLLPVLSFVHRDRCRRRYPEDSIR